MQTDNDNVKILEDPSVVSVTEKHTKMHNHMIINEKENFCPSCLLLIWKTALEIQEKLIA